MKKLLAACLAVVMAAALTACGAQTNPAQEEGQGGQETVSVTDAKELLTTVWDSYAQEDKFAVFGGDASEEHTNMEGPGTYSLEDPQMLDSALGFPAASVDQIDDAASLVHMMNANTFTCGAYHVAEGGDVGAVATAIQNNIANRQWICGFPEQLVIVTVGDYVVAFFGATDLTDAFQSHLTAAYPAAQVVVEQSLA